MLAASADISRSRLWTSLVTVADVTRALGEREEGDQQDLRIQLQIIRSAGGTPRCRLCAVRVLAVADAEAEEQVERRRVAIAALDGMSLAMECAHQHQSDRDIAQACKSFLLTYVAGDPEREAFVRECGGSAYL